MRAGRGAEWEQIGERVAAHRMRRLLRGADVGRARTSTVGRQHAEVEHEVMGPKRGVKRRRVVCDELDPSELRGESWREDTAVRGRGVRMRH